MKKTGKTKFIVILIFCLILAAALLFIGYGVPRISKQSYTEENTKEYTAVYKSKEESNNGIYYLYLNDAECFLVVESAAIINENGFNNLTNGETITFRSVFDFETAKEKGDFITIVSLKTDDAEIITLESSRTAVTKSDIKIKITSTVFAVISLIGAIVCVLYLANVFPIKKR